MENVRKKLTAEEEEGPRSKVKGQAREPVEHRERNREKSLDFSKDGRMDRRTDGCRTRVCVCVCFQFL